MYNNVWGYSEISQIYAVATFEGKIRYASGKILKKKTIVECAFQNNQRRGMGYFIVLFPNLIIVLVYIEREKVFMLLL